MRSLVYDYVPMEQLAAEYVQSENADFGSDLEAAIRSVEVRRELEERMIRRCGQGYAAQYVAQAREVWALLTPPN